MSSTQFKLIQTGPGALMRRVTFAEQPTWFSLASRIELLYGIPMQHVGVSYVDSDGDEITLSTHEELHDYYATVPRIHNDAIKFVVKNLGSLRAQQHPPPSPPGDNLFDMGDEDWQGLNIPNFPRVAIFERSGRSGSPPPPPPKSPSSAFVETVDSASLAEHAAAAAAQNGTITRSGTISPQIIIIEHDKGKAREELQPPIESEDDASSIVSVIRSDTPAKQPVHVYEFDTEEGFIRKSPSPRYRSRSFSRSRTPSPVAPIRLTPPFSPRRRRAGSVTPPSYIPVPSRSSSRFSDNIPAVRIMTPSDPPSPVLDFIPDPPLPTTEETILPQTSSTTGASPSLSNDVAGLLNALTGAFAAHPELSEGLKNIVRNASQGAYWAAERDAMVNDALRATEAAQDAAAQVAQRAQEEAGHKVAEALGGVFRALGGLVGSSVSSIPGQVLGTTVEEPANERPATPEPRGRSVSPVWPPEKARRASVDDYAYRPSYSPPRPDRSPYPPPPGPPPPMHPPSPGSPPRHFPPRGHYHHRPPIPRGPPPPPGHHHHPGPPVPPPPPPHHHHPGPPSPPGHHHRVGLPPQGPPPLPGPPPHAGHPYFGAFPPPMFPPMWGPPPHDGHHALRRSNTLPGRFVGLRGPGAYLGTPLPPPPPPPGSGALSSNARKAQLEEAKQMYKIKKEEWRREKEQRKREKERREAERMERMRQRERLGAPIRQAIVYSSEDELPLPIPAGSSPPGGIPSVNASIKPQPPLPPLDAPFGDWPSLRGRHAEALGRDHQKQRLTRRLADMGFTPRTHPQLEPLVAKHTRKNTEFGGDKDDALIANVLEDLFVTPTPEASGSGIRPGATSRPSPGIPGAWNNI